MSQKHSEARPFRVALAYFVLALSSCSSAPPNEQRDVVLPGYEGFDVVSEPLELHCGSLDCHGIPERNLRLYGWAGVRLDDPMIPEGTGGAPLDALAPDPLAAAPAASASGGAMIIDLPERVPGGEETTEEELWLNYQSVVSLQPELMSVVFVEKTGAAQLLLVSKGRGAEHHKGGAAMKAGDSTDRCIESWLIGQVDETACGESVNQAVVPEAFSTTQEAVEEPTEEEVVAP